VLASVVQGDAVNLNNNNLNRVLHFKKSTAGYVNGYGVFVLVGTMICWNKLLLKIRLSKSLLRFSLTPKPDTILPGNTADTWRKTPLKQLKTNQKK